MTQDKETFNHMMTVVSIILGDARESTLKKFKNNKEWEEAHEEGKRLYKEAKSYVLSWIKANYQNI